MTWTIPRSLNVLAMLAAAYVAAQMMADIASLRIVEVFGLSIDGGTLIYPFTFTLRDMVHKVAGAAVARTLIFTAAAINVVMALLFRIVAVMPADLAVGPQEEFGAVLSPVVRIVIASIVAEVVAELIDTGVYTRWVRRFGETQQWGRVLASNSIAIPIDSVLFSVIAFAGALPASAVIEIMVANILIKGLVTFISIPWIYAVKARDSSLV